uniref:Trafficking protein particle complex subunit 6B n=1 Tax=Sarcophilus harrisii TaxID=9305 RepID=A0A7N4PCN5_SARHA
MADEALFLLLHNEMVTGVYKSADQGEVENGRCITKLENMGFRVGQGLIERFTKDTARFKDELDIMKFICKDFWTTIFKKQIDNLRTNHQGIYVLQDNKFRLLTQMSAGKQYLDHAPKMVLFITEQLELVWIISLLKRATSTRIDYWIVLLLPCIMIS